LRSCWAWLGDVVVPDDEDGAEAVEEDDAGAGEVPVPLLDPSSCPIVLCRLIAGALLDWPPEEVEEELLGLARPDDEDEAVEALGAACWLLEAVVLLAGRLAAEAAAEAVHPVSVGRAPAGAYGGWPPGSGGQVPGLEGSGEFTPGWFGPRNE
jgi:hypothetical protein